MCLTTSLACRKPASFERGDPLAGVEVGGVEQGRRVDGGVAVFGSVERVQPKVKEGRQLGPLKGDLRRGGDRRDGEGAPGAAGQVWIAGALPSRPMPPPPEPWTVSTESRQLHAAERDPAREQKQKPTQSCRRGTGPEGYCSKRGDLSSEKMPAPSFRTNRVPVRRKRREPVFCRNALRGLEAVSVRCGRPEHSQEVVLRLVPEAEAPADAGRRLPAVLPVRRGGHPAPGRPPVRGGRSDPGRLRRGGGGDRAPA